MLDCMSSAERNALSRARAVLAAHLSLDWRQVEITYLAGLGQSDDCHRQKCYFGAKRTDVEPPSWILYGSDKNVELDRAIEIITRAPREAWRSGGFQDGMCHKYGEASNECRKTSSSSGGR